MGTTLNPSLFYLLPNKKKNMNVREDLKPHLCLPRPSLLLHIRYCSSPPLFSHLIAVTCESGSEWQQCRAETQSCAPSPPSRVAPLPQIETQNRHYCSPGPTQKPHCVAAPGCAPRPLRTDPRTPRSLRAGGLRKPTVWRGSPRAPLLSWFLGVFSGFFLLFCCLAQ